MYRIHLTPRQASSPGQGNVATCLWSLIHEEISLCASGNSKTVPCCYAATQRCVAERDFCALSTLHVPTEQLDGVWLFMRELRGLFLNIRVFLERKEMHYHYLVYIRVNASKLYSNLTFSPLRSPNSL